MMTSFMNANTSNAHNLFTFPPALFNEPCGKSQRTKVGTKEKWRNSFSNASNECCYQIETNGKGFVQTTLLCSNLIFLFKGASWVFRFSYGLFFGHCWFHRDCINLFASWGLLLLELYLQGFWWTHWMLRCLQSWDMWWCIHGK